MEQSLPKETNNHISIPEIVSVLWNLRVCYHVQNSLHVIYIYKTQSIANMCYKSECSLLRLGLTGKWVSILVHTVGVFLFTALSDICNFTSIYSGTHWHLY